RLVVQTDFDGKYLMELPVGVHQIKVEYPLLAPDTTEVTITDNQIVKQDFQLFEQKSELDVVVVSAGKFEQSLEELPAEQIEDYLSKHHYKHLDDLLEQIARGNRLPAITAQQMLEAPDSDSEVKEGEVLPVAIRGTEGFMVTYGRCCHPIPGDPIAGYLSSEKGVVVHRERCKNLADMRDKSERLLALRWDDLVTGEYLVELRIEVENRRGMIAVIATRINSMGVNIEKISTEDKDHQFTYVHLEMLVENRVHLARIMKRLRSINSVRKVSRVKN
ncbi:MAG: ACT domain-containing protein, partial [Pseudomonadota bacterium]